MAKLYFKFGTMGSSKTANALMARFDYQKKGQYVLLMKPALDNRDKAGFVTSRTGLSAPCYTFTTDENLLQVFENENAAQNVKAVIVDECQFCKKAQIDQLREVAATCPVLCYGLKTNFKTELFEGSKRLLEIADDISEIKSTCECGRKAIINGRFSGGVLTSEGNEIQIGGDETYKPLCYSCYKKEQMRAMVYEKILKHLEVLSGKDSAGMWSSDTPLDNIVLQKPFVIYDEEVQNFIADFKSFHFNQPEEAVLASDNLKDYQKLPVKDKSFEYMMTLISCVLKIENHKAGFLKALIEDGTITKWLKQIKRAIDKKAD